MTSADPFGAAAARERVLAAWRASPARLREDANAEEDFSLGGYRDRLVVELAQNAADAARAVGEPGRVRFSLSPDGSVLAVANTGAPLDATGVGALATLRASAKREGGSVGRYGVGFAAVLAVTDEPAVLSRTGGVRFSRADTAQLVTELSADVPELADEVRRRDGHVPVLRLPFAAEGEPPQGYTTVVLLPLRDDAAADLTRRLLAGIDDALLLALPDLAEVEVEVDGVTTVVRDASARWVTTARAGAFSPAERAALFADRPVEESHRPWWSVLWALPLSADVPIPSVVHAPTPTDEPLAWPALLVASFPLEPSRRHVAPGPLTDRIVEEAATGYAELLAGRAADGFDVLGLVPSGLGVGALDGALRVAVLDRLRVTPILLSAEDGAPLRPRDAVTVEGLDAAAVRALAPYISGLVDASVGARGALRLLEVPTLALSDVVESLPHAESPTAWRDRFAALESLGETPEGREALAVLPVPLADGRVVRGPRGLLVPPDDVDAELLQELAAAGVRLVDPDAAHPLLLRLGAVAATPRALLADPAVRELVESSPDADDPAAVADVVLGLVRAALAAGDGGPDRSGPVAVGPDWLADLALPDSEGELAPAAALALPGSAAADLFDPDEIGLVATDVVARWGAEVLVACGVLAGLGTLVADDVDLSDPPDALAELDRFTAWAAESVAAAGVDGPAVAGEVRVVRDLDVVRPERWADAVATLAQDPEARAALLSPVRVRDLAGRGRDLPSYTSWWLRHELGLDARVDPAAALALGGLLDPAPAWVGRLDADVRRALGVVRAPADLPPAAANAVLERLAEPDRVVSLPVLLELWAWLSSFPSGRGGEVKPPEQVRAWDGANVVVVDAADPVVVDEPKWLQRKDIGPFVVAPPGRDEALADLLDLGLATERAAGQVTSFGVPVDVPAGATAVVPDAPTQWHRHERLAVDGVEVRWWVDADGQAHAADADGLGAALAWAAGRWRDRGALRAVLADPAHVEAVALDAAFETS